MESFPDLGKNFIIFKKEGEESKIYQIYDVTAKQTGKKICLKVLDKENSNEVEFDDIFFLEQIKKEEKILKKLNSDAIIKINNIIDNTKYYGFEFDYFNISLYNYIREEPFFVRNNINALKEILITLTQALKELKEKGIIHRNIKPENIYMYNINEGKELPDNLKIKLANFDCAVYKDEILTSKPMGSFMYTAPEIINNLEYDEKSDIWSIGIIVYELYFGISPFGNESINKIRKIMNGKEKFIFKKSGIKSLDTLFNKLLCVNPTERMSLEELINFVENKNLYEDIKNKQQNMDKDSDIISNEAYIIDGELINEIPDFFKRINYNTDNIIIKDEELKKEPKFNNIIYFNEIPEEKFRDSVYKDCEKFEEKLIGSFIFCQTIEELNIIKYEILNKNLENNKNYKFILITTGRAWKNCISEYYNKNKDFQNMITNICIYCFDLDTYNKFVDLSKKKDNKINCVGRITSPIIDFIEKNSKKDIELFPVVKLITYDNYKAKYNTLHLLVSCFYGDNKKETFEDSFKKMEELINKEDRNKKLILKNKETLVKSFETFNNKGAKECMESIIKEYTRNTFYKDFNKWQMSLDTQYYLTIAYFSAQLSYNLNKYGEKKKNKKEDYYYKENKVIYRGITTALYNILPYKRAEKKIIIFPSFTSTSFDEKEGRKWAQREDYERNIDGKTKFSVLFYISNKYKKNWISNGIDIHDISRFPEEKEVLYQPFSFYYVKEVDINIKKMKVDIKLETIGKKCILEEEIKLGKEIKYNEKDKIIEVINK